jgi:cytochrome o ubiquinol oxidase operon protein cyoD
MAEQHLVHDHSSEASAGEETYTYRGYFTGFAVAALLTAAAFWVVMGGVFASRALAVAVVVTLAVAQIVVQTAAFLHVNARAQEGWKLVAYIFTAVILLIAIAGSVWIMHHLNINMMPGMMRSGASDIP